MDLLIKYYFMAMHPTYSLHSHAFQNAPSIHKAAVYLSPNQKEESTVQRIFFAALPILATLSPHVGKIFSFAHGSLRSIFAFTEAHQSYQSSHPLHQVSKKIATGLLAIVSVANVFFGHRIASLFTSGLDVLESIETVFQSFNIGDINSLLLSLLHICSSLLSTASLFSFQFEIVSLYLILQVLTSALQSQKEFKTGKYIEGFSNLILCGIHSYRALPSLIKIYQTHQEKMRENIAKVCHRLASFLALPFWIWTEKAFRVFTPIRSDNKEQFENFYLEFLARSFYWAMAFPLFPLFLSLSLIELFPRTLANLIQPHPYFLLNGKGQTKQTSEKISFLTWNLCFVAGGFPRLYAGVPPWRNRISEVLIKIRNENPDVLSLQEVNDLEAAYALYDGLKDLYPYFYVNIGPKVLAQNSGLFVATKLKPENSSFFRSFDLGTGSQSMVNKGFFFFKLLNGLWGKIAVITTHLSPSKDDYKPTEKEEKIRNIELDMIKTEMEKVLDARKMLLVGDMNLRKNSFEWQKNSFLKTHFEQSSIPDVPTCATDYLITTYQGKKPDASMQPFICDYALLYHPNPNAPEKIETKVIEAFDLTKEPFRALSDHHAVGIVLKA